MTKKIFGLAAISALAFGMFACSGEDGADGINGKDGADGANCAVKALKDSSGFKVLCDGDSVGVLLNGIDGANGKDGKAGKDGADGEDGASGDETDGKDGKAGADGKNGANCTAKAVKDGFAIICGKDTVGTLTNGTDGKAGDDCSLTEGDNGSVTIQCGEKKVDLFKGLCPDGKTVFDPETQLCGSYWDDELKKTVYVPIPRCKDWSVYSSYYEDKDQSDAIYSVMYDFCQNNVLYHKCDVKDKDGKISRVEYDGENEYCDLENYKIAKKVPCGDDEEGKKFKKQPDEYCYRKAGDPKTKMRTAKMLTCGTGNAMQTYSPVEKFCAMNNGKLGDKAICASKPAQADPYNIDIRYEASEHLDTHEGQMCDTRDGQIYATKTIGEVTWMKEFLRYAVTQKTADLDSSSFCYKDDGKTNRGDCSIGRYYLWSAAIDSASIAKTNKFCGYTPDGGAAYTECEFEAPFQGICPSGWHLPDESEGPYDKTLGLPYLGLHDVVTTIEADKWAGYGTYLEIWTTDDASKEYATYFGYNPTRTPTNYTDTGYKYKARPVLCIKNPPKEETP